MLMDTSSSTSTVIANLPTPSNSTNLPTLSNSRNQKCEVPIPIRIGSCLKRHP